MKDSLFAVIVERGIEYDHHESDLYLPVTSETTALCDQFGKVPTTFVNQVVGGLWYDVPFAFEPWWESRGSK
jgi:hypothetical protein